MYDLEANLDRRAEPGTNLLLAGPPLTGKRRLGLDVLAGGTRNGEGAIVVSTKDSAERILEEYAERVAYENRPVGVVDCVTRQQGGDVNDTERVKFTSSPVDLTGIGIKLSEFLQDYYEIRDIERNRVLVHSLTTLLIYSDLQTVFRFLHVFTGRIQSVDGLGLFTIDSTAHDAQTLNTLKQLFDGVVRFEEDVEPTVQFSRG
jgi:KaiC/GvpD/RAD55 family RecA-like ATPase